ncbi:2Fe-2S iron-sulfur cluster-binding protein [Salinirubrum litoreum]|uniref:2Fe-2S iron-sulfur cluster-binding protein n=1 Tax=Salinirubrum litoreum TaxID=1126234 RepID=A0ABD5RCL1_9EURY|nr:2Fe-2S iron-sulfur cluster binding domain-containing protein [Salinirubrum litoreum]
MPTVEFRGRTIECEEGATLRTVLREAGVSPHNGSADTINCHGFGTCGTCAVRVEGEVSAMDGGERRRLDFPPHDTESGLRLACQTQVLGDVTVTKYPGFWGQHTDHDPVE